MVTVCLIMYNFVIPSCKFQMREYLQYPQIVNTYMLLKRAFLHSEYSSYPLQKDKIMLIRRI